MIRDRVFWRPRFPEEPRPQGSVEGGGFTIVPDMMSLVGCSGEEFQAILRSLDFRMQKRKVKRPAADCTGCRRGRSRSGNAEVRAGSGSRARSCRRPRRCPSRTGRGSAGDRCWPNRPEAGPETSSSGRSRSMPAEAVSRRSPRPRGRRPKLAPPRRPRRDSEKRSRSRSGGPRIPGPSAASGRSRARPQPARHKRKDGPSEVGEAADRPKRRQARPKPRPSRQAAAPAARRRPEKPIDPDSPFAVLGALKAQLAKKS